MDQEVEAMLKKKAIKKLTSSEDEVVSGYFARPKKNGKWRPIVLLKFTNTSIVYKNIRIVTAVDIATWIRPSYYMALIDLTEAYFSIPGAMQCFGGGALLTSIW